LPSVASQRTKTASKRVGFHAERGLRNVMYKGLKLQMNLILDRATPSDAKAWIKSLFKSAVSDFLT
jgi:hypothetical protein